MRHDADELIDLGESPQYASIRRECHAQMLELVDPDACNTLAFADQAARIEEPGGVEAILRSDEFDFTPVTG